MTTSESVVIRMEIVVALHEGRCIALAPWRPQAGGRLADRRKVPKSPLSFIKGHYFPHFEACWEKSNSKRKVDDMCKWRCDLFPDQLQSEAIDLIKSARLGGLHVANDLVHKVWGYREERNRQSS